MTLRQRAIKDVRCRCLQGYARHGAAPQLQEVLESLLFDGLDELDGLLDLELEEGVLVHREGVSSSACEHNAAAGSASPRSVGGVAVHEFGRQVERRYVPSAFGVASQAVEQRSAPGEHLGGSWLAREAPGRLASSSLE